MWGRTLELPFPVQNTNLESMLLACICVQSTNTGIFKVGNLGILVSWKPTENALGTWSVMGKGTGLQQKPERSHPGAMCRVWELQICPSEMWAVVFGLLLEGRSSGAV